MLATLRTVLNFVVFGAMIGILIASYMGPGYVEWDNRTGAADGGMCLCSKKAREGADRLLGFQMEAAAAGGGVGVLMSIGYLLWRRSKAKKAAANTSVSSVRS